MNDLFVESRLVEELLGKPYSGRSIEGYNTVTEQYESSFVETLGPGSQCNLGPAKTTAG